MKTSSRFAVFMGIVLLLGALILALTGNRDGTTVESRIARTLRDAEDSGRRGSVEGVMETISDDFRAGEWNKARLRLILMRTIGQSDSRDYTLIVSGPLRITPLQGHEDERMVVAKFAAFSAFTGDDIYKTGEPMMLIMREETRRKWLFLREPYWRIAGVVNLPAALPGSDNGLGDLGTKLP